MLTITRVKPSVKDPIAFNKDNTVDKVDSNSKIGGNSKISSDSKCGGNNKVVRAKI